MFETSHTPRVFYVPPGADFPAAVVAGLEARLAPGDPLTLARARLLANSTRMLVRIRDVFEAGPARLMPGMALLTDLPRLAGIARPKAANPLRRRLDLARLLGGAEGLAAGTAFDMAGTLVTLFDEMDEEGVPLSALDGLEVGQFSKHWERALTFVRIAARYDQGQAGRRSIRSEIMALIDQWAASPVQVPLLAVGSTGSRGATAELMAAISRQPQGAVILPGFDPDTPQDVWETLRTQTSEDHPQYRYAVLLDRLGLDPATITPWAEAPAPSAARNRMVSLALRPAPVTNQWLSAGPGLGDLREATDGLTLLEARDQRQEANAIALRIRAAAEQGQSAALISPDRGLTRRVAAALARWEITADDSAGLPLSLTAPGRLLRQLAALGLAGVAADTLIALLKHPLVATGAARGPHLLNTRALELHLRRHGPPYPDAADITRWAAEDETREAWGAWLVALVGRAPNNDLPAFWRWLRGTAEALSAGPGSDGSGALWEEAPGRAANAVLAQLETVSTEDDLLTEIDPVAILAQVMGAEPMNILNVSHPNIMIWGTLDARAQGADLVILGGLNEGSWPGAAVADPWLNRQMRAAAGLRSPERQIGLAAHDFQQAAAAPEVWLTRATKSDDAETVPSRWLNRITTMLGGLKGGGPDALGAMRARGAPWLTDANRLDIAPRARPASRPSPAPPVASRPRKLSVTEIKTLIRDPYAIYAKHVLRLRPLDPLVGAPDALLRGTVLHAVMERVIARGLPAETDAAMALIQEETAATLAAEVAWPAARAMWHARMMRVAPWIITTEQQRAQGVRSAALEASGLLELSGIDFALSGYADRIDITEAGAARIYDYKTGAPPSPSEQKLFDKQLLLEAVMVERGAFREIGPRPVEHAAYIGLGPSPKVQEAPIGEIETWAQFEELIAKMLSPDHGFTARRAMQREVHPSPYDHLARYGEWSAADEPVKVWV